MKIGFIDQLTRGWIAGSTYTRSMVHALRTKASSGAEVILLSGDHSSFPHDQCPIPVARLNSKSPKEIMVTFKEHGLDLLYPISEPFESLQEITCVGWIPDFQHVFLPELFSSEEIRQRDQKFLNLARFTGAVVVSSEAAKQDFRSVLPEYGRKVETVPFPSLLAYETWWQSRDPELTRRKYCLPERFLLVANQIWRHKNHQVVLEALAILKSRGQAPAVVFTGAPSDYRVPRNAHVSHLLQSVSALNIREHAIFLGELAYEEVVDLYRRADAVLQPSKFEGWNTSLQDAKALGKRILASNLLVHKEQASEALFFDPLSAEELAAQIEKLASSFEMESPDHCEASLLHEREMGTRSGARLLEIFDRLKNGFLASSLDQSPSASPPRDNGHSVSTPVEVLPRIKNGSRSVALAESFHKGIMRVYDHLVLPFRFDEHYYRQAHPTAAQALAKGEFRGAIEHYQKVGRKLGLSYARPRCEWIAGSPRKNLRDVPVALFLFNRPALTNLVFARIREFAPTTLLLIADGPRNERDAVLCNRARAVTESVDWPCRVLRDFAPRNLGCRRRVSSGLAWIFENVDEAIILEDDCLPDATFFPFCSELLARYRNDSSIMHISGSCFIPEACTSDSYWFSKHSDIWGWATWRRAFRHYDVDLQSWPWWRRSHRTTGIWKDPIEREYWSQRLDKIRRGELDTWDYQWHWTVYRQRGLGIVPRENLVANLGHGQQGTHTNDERCPLANLPTVPLEAKLNHPRKRVSNELFDRQFFLARYVLSRRAIDPHIPVAVAIDPQRVVVAHDAPTPAQGVGALLCKVMRHENDWISIRSRDCYLEHDLPTRSFRVDAGCTKPNRVLTFKQIVAVLGNTSVSGVLAVPFSEQDCLNATAVQALYNAPLAVWLMDDQNIFSSLISDGVVRELLERATLRLAICEELKEAYQEKFGFPFKVQTPVENPEDLVLDPLDVSPSKRQRVVGCGNIWCEETLRRLMAFAENAPFVIDWYGNLGQPRKHISDEELFAHKIYPKGFLPHASLIARLRQYHLAVVPSPTDGNPRRAWQSKLSFPSKIITLSYAANLPLLYIGSTDEPGARFIRERDLGEVVDWDQPDFAGAWKRLEDPVRATSIRANAAKQAPEFNAKTVMPDIWNALSPSHKHA